MSVNHLIIKPLALAVLSASLTGCFVPSEKVTSASSSSSSSGSTKPSSSSSQVRRLALLALRPASVGSQQTPTVSIPPDPRTKTGLCSFDGVVATAACQVTKMMVTSILRTQLI